MKTRTVVMMTDGEVKGAIDGLMATYYGCGSGIRDDVLKERLKAWLHEDDKRTTEVLRSVILDMLTRANPRYSVEDVYCLFKWLRDDMDFEL